MPVPLMTRMSSASRDSSSTQQLMVNFSLNVNFSGYQNKSRCTPLTSSVGTKVGNLVQQLKSDWTELELDPEEVEKLSEGYYILCNGRRLDKSSCVEEGKVYHIVPRILGGKGGFGSMLRCIGAQIEKTTSREACRDLSGRRMRDINNEKKLKEWLAKEADREKEKEERRAERLARRLDPPKHKFEDSEYQEQKMKVQENLEDALQTGLKRALKKRKPNLEDGPSDAKQRKVNGKEWLGVDLGSDDDSDKEADPGSDSGEHSTEPTHSSSTSPQPTPDTEHSSSEKCTENVQDEVSGTLSNPVPKEVASTRSESLSSQQFKEGETPSQQHKEGEELNTPVTDQASGVIDLNGFPNASGLCELGMEKLKMELMSRGLKCGGTLEERAARLVSVQGLEPEDYPPAIIAKAKGKGKKSK